MRQYPRKAEIAAHIKKMCDGELLKQAHLLGAMQNGLFSQGVEMTYNLLMKEIDERCLEYWDYEAKLVKLR